MKLEVAVLIVGGGITGLWLLAALRAQGVDALLVSDELGKGQTIAAQGIIHGGTKYALTGTVTPAALAIGAMPQVWRAALRGEGAVDLRGVKVLAEHQLLWTTGGLGSRMAGFFAGKVMQSRMAAVAKADYPPLFQHPDFQGDLYRLDEPVVDVPSLLAALRAQLAGHLLQVDAHTATLEPDAGGYAYRAALPDGTDVRIAAQQIVLSAGVGNERLLLSIAARRQPPPLLPQMQRRPLQMVLVRGDLPPLYAHALGLSDKPRLTVTTHYDRAGRAVWYIGGQPAEQGVNKPAAQVVDATRQTLREVLPWLDWRGKEWATWVVERAEGRQADGNRPDQPVIAQHRNLAIVWPTKLAFAPLAAERLLSLCGIQPTPSQPPLATHQPVPLLAVPVWEQAEFQMI